MPPLPLESYARLLAHLAARPRVPLADILAELAISPDDLRESEPALRAQLAESWPRRRGIAAMKFATALGDELTRLGPLGADGDQPKALSGEPLPADGRPREPEVPSFLQAPPAPPPPVPVAPVAAFAAAPDVVAPPPVVQPQADAEPASKSQIAGTIDMDLSAIVSAVKRGAIPFKPAEASTPTMATESPARPTVELPSGAPPPGGTMNADLSAIVASVKRGALPFNAPEGSAPPSVAGAGAEGDLAELPLETYASVTGALARGESREEALARYGLHAEVFDRLAKAWAQRFQREPHLLAKFQDLARNSAASPRRAE